MGMLIVKDEEFELELNRLNKSNEAQVIPLPKKGRPDNCREVPEALRNQIAHDSINKHGTAKEIANAYGISQSSVNAYAGGATSTSRLVEGKLDEKLIENNRKIGRFAQVKLSKALKFMTDSKLESAKATELSTIAANMAKVVEKTTPKVPENVVNNNIVFYSPQQIGEGNFETIDVTPEPVQ
jgi:predicted transcriptional regulator